MISITVISQDAKRVVLEGTVEGLPQLTQRWTISSAALAVNPLLLSQGRDELYAKLQTSEENWRGVQQALQDMQ